MSQRILIILGVLILITLIAILGVLIAVNIKPPLSDVEMTGTWAIEYLTANPDAMDNIMSTVNAEMIGTMAATP